MKWGKIVDKESEEALYDQRVDAIYQVLKEHIDDMNEFGIYHGQSGICLL